jgi:D-arabinose 1-dehydrogenase-like Zn-dependent alcohol dehydrogenase
MRVIVVHESGSADSLSLETRSRPTLRPGQALVQIEAEGVCFRDIVERRGGFPFIKRPVIPGHEFAGRIVELADADAKLQVGQRVVNLHRAPCGACDMCRAGHEPRCRRSLEVFGLSIDGGYAEFVAAPVGALVPLPDGPNGIDPTQACFLGCTAAVALRALRTVARVQPGETVLVAGASGGVGIHAVQVARVLGAQVLAVTSSPEKAAAIGDAGADEVLVVTDAAFHKQVKRVTSGKGVDVVLDCVGTPTLNASLRSLDQRGRLVVVGNVTTDRFEVNPGLVILSELQISGSAGCTRADLEQVLAWVLEGKLRPVVAEVVPLEQAAVAQQRLEAKGVIGRIVLRP